MDAERPIATTLRMFGVSRASLFSPSRARLVAQARQALAYALSESGWSLVSIGALLGRDHTTIIHSIRAANRRMTQNARFAERLRVLVEAAQPGQSCGCGCAARIAELEAQLEARR